MPELSRRDFLRLSAVGLGAVAAGSILEACKSETVSRITPTPEESGASAEPTAAESFEPPPSDTPASASAFASSSASAGASGIPDLVIVRKGEPEPLVRRAIGALGGMERFVPKGANVIVKPNICVAYRSYEYAATTNPWVVAAIVKMALEAGAGSVKVMDFPYGGAADEAYTRSGIKQQVEAAGGQMVVMSSRKFVSTRIPSGKWLRQTDVYDDILKVDVLINAPILKNHGGAVVTAAMKNLMGVVRDRPAMHGNLGQAIADLCTLVKPKLTILDGVRMLTSHGPSGGKLSYVKKLDMVVASTDVVTVDAYAAEVFGMQPNDLDYVKIGTAMGIGRSDLSKLKIEELSV